MLSGIPIPKDAVRPPETVLVNITPQETRVAVLEENNICELHIERNSGHSLVGNIYLGVVKRVLPGMQSAFIDIGLERAAFLHIVDVLEQRRNPDETQRIEHMLFEGQSVLVQVIKDPINTKGARLSLKLLRSASSSMRWEMPATATSSVPTPKTLPMTNCNQTSTI